MMTGQFLYGGVGYYHRNCAFRLAFPPLSQSLPKCAILSHPNSIRCTQMPIESYPLYPRPLIACTSNLQRLMAMGRPLLRYSSSRIFPEMSYFSDLQQLLPSYVNQILGQTTVRSYEIAAF
jgi:hypothetical protein